jgi:hypothetical protein
MSLVPGATSFTPLDMHVRPGYDPGLSQENGAKIY